VKPEAQKSPSALIVGETIQVAGGLPLIVFKHLNYKKRAE
jgi:hypothetical protein